MKVGNPQSVKQYNCHPWFMLHVLCTEIQTSEEKLHISSFDLVISKQLWFLSKRRRYTTRSQTTAFCSYEKSYTFREDMFARFLNAINTDVELNNNQFQHPLQFITSCLDTRKSAILRMDEHGDDIRVIRARRIMVSSGVQVHTQISNFYASRDQRIRAAFSRTQQVNRLMHAFFSVLINKLRCRNSINK